MERFRTAVIVLVMVTVASMHTVMTAPVPRRAPSPYLAEVVGGGILAGKCLHCHDRLLLVPGAAVMLYGRRTPGTTAGRL
jgi:hypothetical protein